MSRMDKYKKIHEESQKEDKKPFGFRREMKKDEKAEQERSIYEEPSYKEPRQTYQEPEKEFYYEDHYQEPKKKRFNLKLPKFKNPFKRKPKNPYEQKLAQNISHDPDCDLRVFGDFFWCW